MSYDQKNLITELIITVCRAIYLAAQLGTPESEASEPKKYFTRKESAEYVSVSLSTFDRYRRNGHIKPHHTIGTRSHRYAQLDLDALNEKIASGEVT